MRNSEKYFPYRTRHRTITTTYFLVFLSKFHYQTDIAGKSELVVDLQPNIEGGHISDPN